MYDFDKTLTYKDMQEYSLIPELGYDDPSKFWAEVTNLKTENNMNMMMTHRHQYGWGAHTY